MGSRELQSGEDLPAWHSEACASYSGCVRVSQQNTGVKGGRPFILLWFQELTNEKLQTIKANPFGRLDQLARGARDQRGRLLPEMWHPRALHHWFQLPRADLHLLFEDLKALGSEDDALQRLANDECGRMLLTGLLAAIRSNLRNFYQNADEWKVLLRQTKDKSWSQVDNSFARPAKAAAQVIMEWLRNPEGIDLCHAAGSWDRFRMRMKMDTAADFDVPFVAVVATPRMVPPVTLPVNASAANINLLIWHAAMRRSIFEEVLLNAFSSAAESPVNICTAGEGDDSKAQRLFTHSEMPADHASFKHSLVWACSTSDKPEGGEAISDASSWLMGHRLLLVSISLDGWSIRVQPPDILEKGERYFLKFMPALHSQMWTADAITEIIFKSFTNGVNTSVPLLRLTGLQGTARVYPVMKPLEDLGLDARALSNLVADAGLTEEQAEVFKATVCCGDSVLYLASKAGAGKSHIMALLLKSWLDGNPSEDRVAILTTPKRMLRLGLLGLVRRILQESRWQKVVVCGLDDENNDMLAAAVEGLVAPNFVEVLQRLTALDVQIALATAANNLDEALSLHTLRMEMLWHEFLLPKSLEQTQVIHNFSVIICTNDKLAKELQCRKSSQLLKGREIDLVFADECQEMPVQMAMMCAACCKTVIFGGDKLQRTVRARQGRHNSPDEDKTPEGWEYHKVKEVGTAMTWTSHTRRSIFDYLEANATTFSFRTMLRCGPEVVELLKLTYLHDFDAVHTLSTTSTNVVCVLFHGAEWGIVADDLGGGVAAETHEGQLRRVYRNRGLFAAIAMAAAKSIDAGQVTVVAFLTHRMRIAFEAYVKVAFNDTQKNAQLLVVGSPEAIGGLTASCVIFVMGCRRYEMEESYAGHCLDATLRYVAMSRAQNQLTLFLEWLWHEDEGWHFRAVQQYVKLFTRQVTPTFRLNSLGRRPFDPLVLTVESDFQECKARLGIHDEEARWFAAYDAVDWWQAACATRQAHPRTVADFFSDEAFFWQSYQDIPRVQEGSEELLKRRRDLYSVYPKWACGDELPKGLCVHVRRLCRLFIPSVVIHLLGRETTFFSIPFAATWFWSKLEGNTLPDYPPSWDNETVSHTEWALHRLISRVVETSIDSDELGLCTGYHKMTEQDVAGFTWLYKRCWSERACFKIQHSAEQRRPSLYAYMGMGVDQQAYDIAGVVIRATSFELIAKLFAAIHEGGGRHVGFSSSNVINNAQKDPVTVAQNFRVAMLLEGLSVTVDAGNLQVGGEAVEPPDANDDIL